MLSPELAALALALAAQGTVDIRPWPNGSQPLEPGVYALIIGVSDYPGESPLEGAAPAAYAFAEALGGTYRPYVEFLASKPPKDTELAAARIEAIGSLAKGQGSAADRGRSLFEQLEALRKDPTRENVDIALEAIHSIPERSLIVFYFAGHGERRGRAGDGALYLRLEGDRAKRGLIPTAVEAKQVLQEIRLATGTKTIVLVDACYSGLALNEAEEEIADRLRHRGFMISASAGIEPTRSGQFTKGLLNVWREWNDAETGCLTSRDLVEELRDWCRASPVAGMTPQSWFGDESYECFAQLDEPSCLVVIDLADFLQIERPIHITFDLNPEGASSEHLRHTVSWDPSNIRRRLPIVARSVPIRAMTILISYKLGTLASLTLTREDLAARHWSMQPVRQETALREDLEQLKVDSMIRVGDYLAQHDEEPSAILHSAHARISHLAKLDGGVKADIATIYRDSGQYEEARSKLDQWEFSRRGYNAGEFTVECSSTPGRVELGAEDVKAIFLSTPSPTKSMTYLISILDADEKAALLSSFEQAGDYASSSQLWAWSDADANLEERIYGYVRGILAADEARSREQLPDELAATLSTRLEAATRRVIEGGKVSPLEVEEIAVRARYEFEVRAQSPSPHVVVPIAPLADEGASPRDDGDCYRLTLEVSSGATMVIREGTPLETWQEDGLQAVVAWMSEQETLGTLPHLEDRYVPTSVFSLRPLRGLRRLSGESVPVTAVLSALLQSNRICVEAVGTRGSWSGSASDPGVGNGPSARGIFRTTGHPSLTLAPALFPRPVEEGVQGSIRMHRSNAYFTRDLAACAAVLTHLTAHLMVPVADAATADEYEAFANEFTSRFMGNLGRADEDPAVLEIVDRVIGAIEKNTFHRGLL